MKKWSGEFVLNYQILNQNIFQKYLKIKGYSFPKAIQKRAPVINPSKIQYRN